MPAVLLVLSLLLLSFIGGCAQPEMPSDSPLQAEALFLYRQELHDAGGFRVLASRAHEKVATDLWYTYCNIDIFLTTIGSYQHESAAGFRGWLYVVAKRRAMLLASREHRYVACDRPLPAVDDGLATAADRIAVDRASTILGTCGQEVDEVQRCRSDRASTRTRSSM